MISETIDDRLLSEYVLQTKRKKKKKMKWPKYYIPLKYRGYVKGWLEMTKTEVIKKLKEWGIPAHGNTLLNWEEWGLIPKATFRSGNATEYPDHTPAEFFASYKQKHGDWKVPASQITAIRGMALIIDRDTGHLRTLSPSYPWSIGVNQLFSHSIAWLLDRERASKGFPEKKIRLTYTIKDKEIISREVEPSHEDDIVIKEL